MVLMFNCRMVEIIVAFIFRHNLLLCRYVRDFEVETIGMKETSRRCSDLKCGAKLKDTVLDWEVGIYSTWFHYS